MSLVSVAAGYARRNAKDAALPVGVLGGGAALAEREKHRQHRKAAGAIAGGAAAEGAWRGVGLGVVQAAGKKREGPLPGQSKSNYQKQVKDHKHAHGVGGKQGPELRAALRGKPEYFRTYPKTLGGWKHKRALGQMSGRRGLLAEGLVVAGGSAVGRRVASGHDPVSKGLLTDALKVGALGLGARALAGSPGMRGLREGAATVRGEGGMKSAWTVANGPHGPLKPSVVHNANAVFTRMPTAAIGRNAAALGVTYHANRSR